MTVSRKQIDVKLQFISSQDAEFKRLKTKLADLQRKVRSRVRSEYIWSSKCLHPEKQLFDWSMMRLSRPSYGVGDAFGVDSDNHLKKKRDAERLSKIEEEERNRVEIKKRKFFAEILNGIRELQLQVQASQKGRKQRSDGVQHFFRWTNIFNWPATIILSICVCNMLLPPGCILKGAAYGTGLGYNFGYGAGGYGSYGRTGSYCSHLDLMDCMVRNLK